MIDFPSQVELDFHKPIDPPEPARIKSAADTLPPEVLQIIGYLHRNARGRDNATAAGAIAQDLAIGDAQGRMVRSLVSQYQDAFPWVVCGTPGKGYFITEDPSDMEHYERSLHDTLVSIAARIRAFKRNASSCGYDRIGSGPHVIYQERVV